MSIVRLSRVSLRFAGRPLIDQLSFSVGAGDALAIVGPGSSGKTIIARILTGQIGPDEGGTVLPSREEIGYLPQQRAFYNDVPVLRSLIYFAMLRGLSGHEARRRARLWLERFALADRGDEYFGTLPADAQLRLMLAPALMHQPKLVVLDEPFTGLDPARQEVLFTMLRELHQSGTAVVLTTSDMDLVERAAGHVLLLNRGRGILAGALEELRGRQYAAGAPMLRDLLIETLRGDSAA